MISYCQINAKLSVMTKLENLVPYLKNYAKLRNKEIFTAKFL